MDTLTVDLTAILVDNPSIFSVRTKVNLVLENTGRGLTVENLEVSPRSAHRFNASNAGDLGCGETYYLTAHQSSFVLAIACSLANPRVLFSPLRPYELLASLESRKSPSADRSVTNAIQTVGGITETIGVAIGIELAMDVTEVLSLADRLLQLRLFDRGKRSPLEHNVFGAIFTYWEALKSTDGLNCYKRLYDAFEKAVNADRGRRGEAFEAIASNMVGLSVTDIRKLQDFDGRVKHVLKSQGAFNLLEVGETKLGQKALVLKKAADSALLSRI